jgi:hypothetical protein
LAQRIGLAIALIAAIGTLLTVPEIRRFLGLEKSTAASSTSKPSSQERESDIAAPSVTQPLPAEIAKAEGSTTISQATAQKPNPALSSSTRETIGQFYSDMIVVEANDTGTVFINGHPELTKLVQFCPDQWAENCSKNIVVQRDRDSFKLDKGSIAKHQNAFNFKDSDGFWLQIKSNIIKTGSNVSISTGRNGSYFVYENM